MRKRWVVGAALVCVLVAGVAAATTAGVLTRPTAAVSAAAPAQQEVNRAAVVVNFGDNNVQTQCVSFTEQVITAEALLLRAGFDFSLDQRGEVCRIGAVGCPTSNCFCQCGVAECVFWGYFHWVGDRWQRALDSMTWFEVRNGQVEGWSWGSANFAIGVPPPLITFEQICPSPGAPPTPTPTATSQPTSTVMPTQPLVPEVVFQADDWQVMSGACTALRWQVLNADQVTLDGQPVAIADQREVCPEVTQRFVLTASNLAGQTTRDVMVQVVSLPRTAAVTVTPVPDWTGGPQTPGPATVGAGAVTPPSALEPSTTAALTPDLRALLLGAPATATPMRRELPAGPTATALLRLGEATTPTPEVELPEAASPQRFLTLSVGLLLGAGILFAIVFWVLRTTRTPER